jgi:outer membrane protein TolC
VATQVRAWIVAAGCLVVGVSARGQTVAPEAPKRTSTIPAPRRFSLGDSVPSAATFSSVPPPQSAQGPVSTSAPAAGPAAPPDVAGGSSTVPGALPLPASGPFSRGAGLTTPPVAQGAGLTTPPAADSMKTHGSFVLDTSLIPGRSIEPIDLVNALRLTGARELDIALSQQQLNQAIADLHYAYALWLPSLFIGPTWYRADGQVQTVNGPVQTVARSSLFIGGLAATTAPGFAAASPGTGYAPLNGMSSVFRFSDALYMPLAARRVVGAGQAGVRAATNDAMLQVPEAYFDLQQACGRLAISREAAANAQTLSEITGSYARTGQGLEADHRRALTEVKHRQREIELYSGQLLIASANLVRLLVLNPRIVVAPVEPAETIIRLIPDDVPLDDLVVKALQQRPELAGAQELVQAALYRLKQARLRPFVPSLALSYDGGGFGGGAGSFFGNFGTRGDVAASLFWEFQNLGFGDCAIMQRRKFEHSAANIQKVKVEAQVAADVVSAYETAQFATRQITQARETVTEALDSLKLNLINIREGAELPRATRPIEVLQPIQALAQARIDYLDSVLGYNRGQFRLNRAIGRP